MRYKAFFISRKSELYWCIINMNGCGRKGARPQVLVQVHVCTSMYITWGKGAHEEELAYLLAQLVAQRPS